VRVDVWAHVFLTLARIGEWSVLHPGRFTPGKEFPVPTAYQEGAPYIEYVYMFEKIFIHGAWKFVYYYDVGLIPNALSVRKYG
jgi:hypothetical protein